MDACLSVIEQSEATNKLPKLCLPFQFYED